jgi:hypothetical protein
MLQIEDLTAHKTLVSLTRSDKMNADLTDFFIDAFEEPLQLIISTCNDLLKSIPVFKHRCDANIINQTAKLLSFKLCEKKHQKLLQQNKLPSATASISPV